MAIRRWSSCCWLLALTSMPKTITGSRHLTAVYRRQYGTADEIWDAGGRQAKTAAPDGEDEQGDEEQDENNAPSSPATLLARAPSRREGTSFWKGRCSCTLQ